MINSIAVIGGGPGGLFFATLIKTRRPEVSVAVFERNRPGDTFGFGVVFSDATLDRIHAADPVLESALAEHGKHWDPIDVRMKGERIRCAGNGMTAIVRRTLLELLHRRAVAAGVTVRNSRAVTPDGPELAGFDLVVAADGANSSFRAAAEDRLGSTVEVARAKFIWFGAEHPFEGLTFLFAPSEYGTFAVHAYPIADGRSTFIVETDEATWRAAGLDEFDVGQPPGPSDEKSRVLLAKLFAEPLEGAPLLINNSRWGSFRTRRTRRWHHDRTVYLGDAVHTAHFSVGSGTKMAMEDAIALADALDAHPNDLAAAFDAYQTVRQPAVERIQAAARPSLSWWENFGLYHEAFDPTTFAFHFLSRSIPRSKLARRDPDLVDAVSRAWRDRHGGADPLTTPLTAGRHRFDRRLVEVGDPPGPVIMAPAAPSEVPAAVDRVLRTAGELAIVDGGTLITRILVSEQLRLRGGRPTMIIMDRDEAADAELADRAETLLLSGRADLVGVRRS